MPIDLSFLKFLFPSFGSDRLVRVRNLCVFTKKRGRYIII